MKQQMRNEQANRILRIQSQADEAVKDNRDKALGVLKELATKEEEDFAEEFAMLETAEGSPVQNLTFES